LPSTPIRAAAALRDDLAVLGQQPRQRDLSRRGLCGVREGGGDHHLIPHGVQCLAHEFLVDVGSVYLGGVEECDAQVYRVPQDGDHCLPVFRLGP
jgi:hypothetical protein